MLRRLLRDYNLIVNELHTEFYRWDKQMGAAWIYVDLEIDYPEEVLYEYDVEDIDEKFEEHAVDNLVEYLNGEARRRKLAKYDNDIASIQGHWRLGTWVKIKIPTFIEERVFLREHVNIELAEFEKEYNGINELRSYVYWCREYLTKWAEIHRKRWSNPAYILQFFADDEDEYDY